jgi:hypothetical protein
MRRQISVLDKSIITIIMKKRLTMYLTVGSDEKEIYNVFNCWFR